MSKNEIETRTVEGYVFARATGSFHHDDAAAFFTQIIRVALASNVRRVRLDVRSVEEKMIGRAVTLSQMWGTFSGTAELTWR